MDLIVCDGDLNNNNTFELFYNIMHREPDVFGIAYRKIISSALPVLFIVFVGL